MIVQLLREMMFVHQQLRVETGDSQVLAQSEQESEHGVRPELDYWSLTKMILTRRMEVTGPVKAMFNGVDSSPLPRTRKTLGGGTRIHKPGEVFPNSMLVELVEPFSTDRTLLLPSTSRGSHLHNDLNDCRER